MPGRRHYLIVSYQSCWKILPYEENMGAGIVFHGMKDNQRTIPCPLFWLRANLSAKLQFRAIVSTFYEMTRGVCGVDRAEVAWNIRLCGFDDNLRCVFYIRLDVWSRRFFTPGGKFLCETELFGVSKGDFAERYGGVEKMTPYTNWLCCKGGKGIQPMSPEAQGFIGVCQFANLKYRQTFLERKSGRRYKV